MKANFQMRALVAFALSFGGLACQGEEPEQTAAPTPVYAADSSAQSFVRAIREGLAQGKRPPADRVQRLKSIGMLYPEEPEVEQVLLSILPALKDWDGLAPYLEAKAELSNEMRMMLTKVYISQADYEAALRTALELAEAEPSHVDANAFTARAYYFLGKPEEAVRFYDRVWSQVVEQHRVADIANRAMISFDAGDLNAAIEMLQGALEDNADSVHLHNAMARLLAAKGELDEAERHSRIVTALQAKVSKLEQNAMLRAAQTLALNEAWAKKDFNECQRLIYEFLPGAEEDFRNELLRFLGSMYEATGRRAEASAAIEAAHRHATSGKKP